MPRGHWGAYVATLGIAGVLLAAAPPPATHLQPPPVSAGKQGQPIQDKAAHKEPAPAPDLRGTKERPLIVETHQAPETEAEAEKDAAYREHKTSDQDILTFARWTLGITVLQTIIFALTLLATAFVALRQLRAYLSVEITDLINPGIGLPMIANFIIHNDGETPAYDVQHLAGMLVMRHPLANDQGDVFMPHPKDTRRPNHTVFRKRTINGEAFLPPNEGGDSEEPFGTRPAPFSKEAFTAATTNPDYRLYVLGIVFYRDTFGFRRKTRFAAYIDPEELLRIQVEKGQGGTKENPIVRGRVEWSLSHAHNDAT